MSSGGPGWPILTFGVWLVCAGFAACGAESPPEPDVPAPAGDRGAVVEVGCADGGPAPDRARGGDLPYGPFLLMGIDESGVPPRHRQTGIDRPPDAFDGHGYKVPVSLPDGTSAVLAIVGGERGRLGFVFTHEAQRRVVREGVAGADQQIRFTACARGEGPGRTGWPGGFVVDEPHCATVTVNPGTSPATNFGLPLGSACPGPR